MIKKPLLIIQLRPEAGIAESEYACILKYGQISATSTKRLRIEKTGLPSDISLDDYSAIIVGGSPFDISTTVDKKTDSQKKIEADFQQLLNRVIDRDFPFLGACSGSGLLGNYLGATISTQYGEDVGCKTLTITEAGKQDKLLQGFPEQIDALLGHKEACDITPEGVTLLVTGETCPVQMFRIGNNVYATQFHPEADAGEFTLRIETYKNHGYFEPHEAEELIEALKQRPTPYSHEILRRFVEIYAL